MKSRFELEHIGINTPDPESAEKLASLLSMMFNLEPRHGQKSEFGGPYFECMKSPFLGTSGHIAMRTPDLAAAVEELKEKAFPSTWTPPPTTRTGPLKTCIWTASSEALPSISCRSNEKISSRGLRLEIFSLL